MEHQEDQKKKPFFAKFLETQCKKEEEATLFAEGLTLKIWDQIFQTQKYPSDSDEV